MIPYIIGGVLLGMLLCDSESDKKKAEKKYNDAKENAKKNLNNRFRNAKQKDDLDKLFKMKKLKVKVANDIYEELSSIRKDYHSININLKQSKDALSELFAQKKSALTQKEKREIQENINIVIEARKNIFKTKDLMKDTIDILQTNLKIENRNTTFLKEEIGKILKNR